MGNGSQEIDEGKEYIGYHDALQLVRSKISPVGVEELSLELCTKRVVAEDLVALIDNPLSDVSLKDGFAVKSHDVAGASLERPVRLGLIGSVFAGSGFNGVVTSGTAVKVCSGSRIPSGADAVVAVELCDEASSSVYIKANAESGRNILTTGQDVKAGTVIIEKGRALLPGCIGLAAAAGINHIQVYRKPEVAVLATGDEIVLPGVDLRPGQLYASNLVTMTAWLSTLSIPYRTAIVGDDEDDIRKEFMDLLPNVDAVLTSGGAWGSERDLIVGVLDELGWQKAFHRVRIGPGKAIAFGLWNGKPIFCLPGGPTSNEMAFIQIVLPGILLMGGYSRYLLPTVSAKLTMDLKGRQPGWTEFKDAILSHNKDGSYMVTPYKDKSRLQAIANTTCLICIPEGVESLNRGDVVPVQIIAPGLGDLDIYYDSNL